MNTRRVWPRISEDFSSLLWLAFIFYIIAFLAVLNTYKLDGPISDDGDIDLQESRSLIGDTPSSP